MGRVPCDVGGVDGLGGGGGVCGGQRAVTPQVPEFRTRVIIRAVHTFLGFGFAVLVVNNMGLFWPVHSGSGAGCVFGSGEKGSQRA